MTYRLHVPGEMPKALRWTDQHALSRCGAGVLLFRGASDPLDGAAFRVLRDRRGAWIETDKPDQARRALGLPLGESLGGPR